MWEIFMPIPINGSRRIGNITMPNSVIVMFGWSISHHINKFICCSDKFIHVMSNWPSYRLYQNRTYTILMRILRIRINAQNCTGNSYAPARPRRRFAILRIANGCAYRSPLNSHKTIVLNSVESPKSIKRWYG